MANHAGVISFSKPEIRINRISGTIRSENEKISWKWQNQPFSAKTIKINMFINLRISSPEHLVLFFEADNDHFHMNLSDISERPKENGQRLYNIVKTEDFLF